MVGEEIRKGVRAAIVVSECNMAASDYISDRGKLMCERLTDTCLLYEDTTSNFHVLGQIGEGGFGSVFEVCNKASGQRGAMKKLPYDPQGTRSLSDSVTTITTVNERMFRANVCIQNGID